MKHESIILSLLTLLVGVSAVKDLFNLPVNDPENPQRNTPTQWALFVLLLILTAWAVIALITTTQPVL